MGRQEAGRMVKEAEEELEKLGLSGPQIDMAHEKWGLDIENSKKKFADASKRWQEVRYVILPHSSLQR